MPKSEGPREVVAEDFPKPEESPASDVTVDLEKPEVPPKQASEAEQLAAAIREDFEKLYGGRLRQLENTANGARRLQDDVDRLKRENEDLKRQTVTPTPPAAAPGQVDELDKLVEAGRWKEAVRLIGRQEAEELLKQREVLQQQEQSLVNAQRLQEASKREVMAKYPDLDIENGNPDSEVSKAFISILNQHEEYKNNVFGPKLAMHDMEDLLRAKGVDPVQFQATAPLAPGANQEVIRRAHASAATLPPSRGTVKGTTVTLSKEDKEFCDYHKIKYEDFAKTLRSLEQTGGVSL